MPIERTKTQQTPGLLATPGRKGRGGQEVPQTPAGVSMLRAESSDKPKTRVEGRTPGPACYTINAKGCSSNFYGVVKPQEEPMWHDLLASRDLLSEHSSSLGQVDQSVVVGQTWGDSGLPSQVL